MSYRPYRRFLSKQYMCKARANTIILIYVSTYFSKSSLRSLIFLTTLQIYNEGIETSWEETLAQSISLFLGRRQKYKSRQNSSPVSSQNLLTVLTLVTDYSTMFLTFSLSTNCYIGIIFKIEKITFPTIKYVDKYGS